METGMKKSRVLVLAGSTRKESLHRKLAVQAVEALEAIGIEATFADLRDFALPIYDGDLEAEKGMPAAAKALKELARTADGFLIASPEYNGSYPAVLKNAIDWISRPEAGERHLEVFAGKVAAIASASPGPGGGRRVLRQLRELLDMMRVSVIAEELPIPRATPALDPAGVATLANALGLALAQRQEVVA
jgi:NAD(P)H-dependent FMN reductase